MGSDRRKTSPIGNKSAFLLPAILLLLTVVTVIGYRFITLQPLISEDVTSKSTALSSEYQTNTSRRLAQLDPKYIEQQRQLREPTEQQINALNSAVADLFRAAKLRDTVALDSAAPKYVALINGTTSTYLKAQHRNILALTIENDYPEALGALVKAGMPCGLDSGFGRDGYRAATKANNKVFLETLLEGGCAVSKGNISSTILNGIAASDYPERLLMVPGVNLDAARQLDEVFLLKFGTMDESLVLALLDKGVNPNTYIKGAGTPLYQAIKRKSPRLARELIDRGADSRFRLNPSQPLLQQAIFHSEIETVRYILEIDPAYIAEDTSHASYLRAALFTRNKEHVATLLKLVFEAEGALEHHIPDSFGLLRATIERQNPEAARLLLEFGIKPNMMHKLQTPLLLARRLLKDAPDAQSRVPYEQIVDILEQYGASDDILALYRAANHLAKEPNCRVGKAIEYNLKRPPSVEGYWDPFEPNSCVSELKYCRRNGIDADDCMRSVLTCSSKPEARCCTVQQKEDYFDGRCSGMEVEEAYAWLSRQ